jgi:hypothetical protein
LLHHSTDLMKSSHVVTLGSLFFLAWLSASFFSQHRIESRAGEKAAISSPKSIPATKLVPAQKREVVQSEETSAKAQP